MEKCEGYCGISCIDGSCPIARADEYAERGYDIVDNCDECYRYGGCDDCYFEGTDLCSKLRADNIALKNEYLKGGN